MYRLNLWAVLVLGIGVGPTSEPRDVGVAVT